MAILDVSGNPLPGASTAQVLGFTEPPPPPEVLPLRIYNFLLEPIRIEDAKAEGKFFVKRFLQGPQDQWAQTQQKIFSIKDLWNLDKVEDKFLPFLKNIVGWTSELESITDLLDSPTLRKLIGASVPLWKKRGTEDALIDVLLLVTGARDRIWNWFDFKFVLDETGMGESHQGRDPYIIELPGPPNVSEYRSNLRIVDDGNLNRTLVEELTKLMRPVGERIEVSYITLLDLFTATGDNTQWSAAATPASVPFVVEDGVAKADDTGEQLQVVDTVLRPEALDWAGYSAPF